MIIGIAAHNKADRGLCEADYRGQEEEEEDEERAREEARRHRRGGGCRGRLLSVIVFSSLLNAIYYQLPISIQALEKGEEEVEEDSDDESEEDDDDTPGEKSLITKIAIKQKVSSIHVTSAFLKLVC